MVIIKNMIRKIQLEDPMMKIQKEINKEVNGKDKLPKEISEMIKTKDHNGLISNWLIKIESIQEKENKIHHQKFPEN